MAIDWTGIYPAMTTAFREDGAVDLEFVARHAAWLMENGCAGIVALGSLGEGATLDPGEKSALLETCVQAIGDKPVVAGVSALSTQQAVEMARLAEAKGARGLMVLPPYAYSTDWCEMKAHVAAVLRATALPCMLYNNPVAYQTDFLPAQIRELAGEHANLAAVKESSADARRVTAIQAHCGDRLKLMVGVDDGIVEGIRAGATGWVAGLVNALPRESVALFDGARNGADVSGLYHWFLPLLRLDTVPKFVQLIKLVQQELGMGSEKVRPPRLELTGAERDEALKTIRFALDNRPAL